jgi:predicted ArsR family transcriptional regulator
MVVFSMAVIDEKPSRQKIIMLLKKTECMTVAELSRQIGITPMAVRQHLMALERQGIIRYVVKKSGIGRPVFLYRLTDKADNIFPKAYEKLINDVFRALEKTDGKRKIEKIFELRKERLLTEYRSAISNSNPLSTKVATLADLLNADGYMVEMEETSKKFNLRLYNCPISGVAYEFGQACKYELQLYKELLNIDVQREQCQREGAPACTYIIPKE